MSSALRWRQGRETNNEVQNEYLSWPATVFLLEAHECMEFIWWKIALEEEEQINLFISGAHLKVHLSIFIHRESR